MVKLSPFDGNSAIGRNINTAVFGARVSMVQLSTTHDALYGIKKHGGHNSG